MKPEVVRAFYNQEDVVEHYVYAASRVGLWESEEIVCKRVFDPAKPLLELGCGAGRIAIGLWELDYKNIVAIDFSRQMVEHAKQINRALVYGVDFRVGDATRLTFEDASFAGAIFGFNGLMQIPKRKNRHRAIAEAFRVIEPGGYFVFTSHDRASPRNRKYWKKEQARWNDGQQQEELDEYGDIYRETEFGEMYIHSPERDEVREDLRECGFVLESEMPRSKIAVESARVRDFADECRFWIARKPK